MKTTLIVLLALFLVAGCKQSAVDQSPVNVSLEPSLLLLSHVKPGMDANAVESLAGAPSLVVKGIPTMKEMQRSGRRAKLIQPEHFDRYITWFFAPSRIDTIRGGKDMALFNEQQDYEDVPEAVPVGLLRLTFAVVIDRQTNLVTSAGYLPRGFVDLRGNIKRGAIL